MADVRAVGPGDKESRMQFSGADISASRTEDAGAKRDCVNHDKSLNHQKIGFLNLPMELRLMIYKLCLTSAYPDIHICHRKDFEIAQNRNRRSRLLVNLLATNQQIHEEAAEFLYSQMFRFNCLRTFDRFMSAIGDINIVRLQQIYITDPYPDLCSTADSLCRAKNLKVVRLNMRLFRSQRWADHNGEEFGDYVFIWMKVWLKKLLRNMHSPSSILSILQMDYQVFAPAWKPATQAQRKAAYETRLLELLQARADTSWPFTGVCQTTIKVER